jgi:hypothetical protein
LNFAILEYGSVVEALMVKEQFKKIIQNFVGEVVPIGLCKLSWNFELGGVENYVGWSAFGKEIDFREHDSLVYLMDSVMKCN